MQNKILRKGLVVGLIILFISICVLSSVSSKDVSVSKDIIKEDNTETPLWDDYDEKFAVIRGAGHFTDYEEWYGGYFGPVGIVINLSFSGGTFHILAFTKNPSKPIYNVEANKLIIKRFVGIFVIPGYYYGSILGYALGDIYWE
jgi:hypothetical protein